MKNAIIGLLESVKEEIEFLNVKPNTDTDKAFNLGVESAAYIVNRTIKRIQEKMES